ncbi:C48 family peptidase [Wolbachia endosymbiont of Zaprionus taronus]|uniref:cytoplasmic incompatibility factor CifB n=1 Tax=Wolbachia endosymbiont of Zaprionus taronus TaxID=2603208 RepID=UPI002948F93D|nr:cytoplasmic incompatibility factor CifB [Wolbachia endosymbiont of Zaprionus taronus]MDV6248571.1 cytoplasmic incompatibility factor CifB [Wolbachia endosymbiont of Zaprionus taronus]
MSSGDGFVRSLVDGDLEGFRQRFESFLDQCPSFLHYVNAGRFLPICFFSMFATAHDANILNANERVYFRFDNHGVNPRNGENRNTGNLKIAVYRDGQQVVRCYSISDRPNSDGLRFSERERDFLVQEIIRQNQGLMEEDLNFEQYKVCMHGKGKSQGEAIATVFEVIREKDLRGRDKFGKYSASEINLIRRLLRDHRLTIKEIEGRQLNQNQLRQLGRSVNFTRVEPGQQRIDNFMEMLASNQRQDVRDSLRGDILEYVTDTYNNYRAQIENNIEGRSQKFESHGFLLGFLANFSHRYTIGIDLDLSPRNSHVAFLVRHQEERGNVPIVINIATGATLSSTALDCARGHAKRLYVSSFIPIHTTSEHTVCVGLNFDLNRIPFRVDTVGLQQGRFPLVQRLFECLENEGIRENIRDFLLYHLPAEIPMNAENYNRIFDYITGFAFGSSAFDRHPLELEEGDEAPITKYIFRHGDESLRCLTMVFHAEGSDIVILHIRAYDAQQQEAIDLQALNVNRNNVHVWEVSCTLNDQFELDIDRPNDLGLYHDYQNNNANNFLDGDLIQVPNVENVHGISERVMNDGWQNVGQHRELFQEISGILMPLRNAINVNSEDKFRSILHGTFYASDNPYKVLAMYKVGQKYSLKRGQEEEGERVVLTRITEQRLDLLLLRQPTENDLDTHPIGYVLRFAGNVEEVAQKENNAKDRIKELMNKQRGYLLITSGNEVVLFPLVFNAGAGRVEGLISIPEGIGREEYVHILDRGGRDSRPGGLVGPESVIDENPPEGLLSDVTRKRLVDYFQSDQRHDFIPLCDLGNNQWAAFRYLEGDKEQVIRKLRSGTDGTAHTSPTAQGILERINNVLGDGNSIQDVNDLITLDFATDNGYYGYWLQQHDITYVARAQRYNFPVENEMRFNVVGISGNQVDVLETHIRNFKNEGNVGPRRSILIVNLGGNHWVTLVIDYRNGNYIGYYADSLGHNVLNSVRRVLEDNNVTLHNILIDQQGNRLVQQKDGYNCGFWALENARDINEVLQQNNNLGNRGGGVLDEMRNSLTLNVPGLNNIVDENNLRNEEYFKVLRRDISRELRDVNTNAGRARSDDAGNPDSVMSFIINNQNNPEIRRLLLEYLASFRPQLSHFNKEQQAALLQFVSSSFPNASIELVKQGLYLPSFEERGVNVNGKCIAITRGLSQALSLHEDKSFLNTLKTSTEIYERIAQGKQISRKEEKEVFTFSKLLSSFEEQVDCVTSTLPSSLTHSRSYKMFSNLSNYIAEINDDFALHLVTSNHVVAIYRTGDNYAYFDSNAAFISELKSVDQLMQVVEKGIEFAGYEIGEKGFLIEHFNVNQANNLLADKDKQTLTKEIQTERQLLAKQDKELGLIKINGQEVSRVRLYDFRTKINVKGSVPLLINADMKLNSEKFLDYLDKKEVSMTAREYLDNLQNSKNVKEVVQATKAIPFEGSNREVKEAEHNRSSELKFSMKQLIEYLLTAIISSKQKSQLSENNSKSDGNPNHYLDSVTINNQSKESQRYQSVSF